jgi:UPF0755 protein
MRRVLPLLLALAAVVCAAALGLHRQYRHFVDEPLDIAATENIMVQRGASVRAVLVTLEDRGLTRLDWRWRLFLRLHPVTIRAGEYALQAGLRPAGLLELLASGRVVTYRFTIIEGWTFTQLRNALEEDPVLLQTLADIGDDAAIMAALGSPSTHPEGLFLPETYQFVRGDSDFDLLGRAHRAMQDELANAWERRAEGLPLKNEYELLILASIVEKESSLTSERPDIAGVFVRRLRQGWKLETDPTVIYGLGEAFDGDIRTRDLRMDNPYNTYTRHGLPPTPIALPGAPAIAAAARPAEGTAMFFVADGTGGHVFSVTLEEHNEAVRKMLSRKP